MPWKWETWFLAKPLLSFQVSQPKGAPIRLQNVVNKQYLLLLDHCSSKKQTMSSIEESKSISQPTAEKITCKHKGGIPIHRRQCIRILRERAEMGPQTKPLHCKLFLLVYMLIGIWTSQFLKAASNVCTHITNLCSIQRKMFPTICPN